MSKKSFLVLFLSFIFICISTNVPAQSVKRSYPKMRVYMTGESESFGSFGYAAIESFEKALKEQNLLTAKDDETASDLVIKVKEINDEQVAISIVILDPMPKEAIQLAAKAELLYAHLSEKQKAELPLEGKAIREYASAEYMKQFRMLWNDYIDVISKSQIDQFSHKIVKDYMDN